LEPPPESALLSPVSPRSQPQELSRKGSDKLKKKKQRKSKNTPESVLRFVFLTFDFASS
jgi:hypothetical protein